MMNHQAPAKLQHEWSFEHEPHNYFSDLQIDSLNSSYQSRNQSNIAAGYYSQADII